MGWAGDSLYFLIVKVDYFVEVAFKLATESLHFLFVSLGHELSNDLFCYVSTNVFLVVSPLVLGLAILFVALSPILTEIGDEWLLF